MADGLHCRDCGWYESDHVEMIGVDDKALRDSTGFRYSLMNCPEFNPDPKGVRAVQAQKDKEEGWAATVYAGRAQTRTIIMADILSGRWGKGWQNVARQLTTY